ncbi:MAG: metal-dependent transcriptional regulator [Lachnospiraceae bacterium]
MSVSLIRCLLAVLALSETCDAVASKDVAHLLGVKRPTIHRSLQLLVEKGMIEKELYGDVFLTEKGRAMARTLETRRDDLALLFARQFGLSPRKASRQPLL